MEKKFRTSLAKREIGDDAKEAYGAWRTAVLYLELLDQQSKAKSDLKKLEATLDELTKLTYPTLTEGEVKAIATKEKWLPALRQGLVAELDRISQGLTTRVQELSERYAEPLPQLEEEVEEISGKVMQHLASMGVVWN